MHPTDSAWLESLFASIDAMDTQGFVSHLSADAEFRFGNLPPVNGTGQIAAMVDGFFQSIGGLRHVLHEQWACGDTLICRGTVTYRRLDGKEVALPFANIMQRTGLLASRYHIYGDVSPVYAPSAA